MILRALAICTLSMLVFLASVMAQAPALKCLAVDVAGDVQLTWEVPSDSCGSFSNYYIYNSLLLAGPYLLIDSIANFNVNTYTHVGANADLTSRFYYVRANSGCVNTTSDTLETMFLSVGNTSGGTANMSWNTLHTPPVPTSTEMMQIFREDPISGLLTLIDSSYQISTYADPFTTCSDSIDYQIFVLDSSGCISSSNIAFLEPDIIAPVQVIIDSVSVDPITGLAIIGWEVSTSIDVVAYIIYVANAFGGWDSVGISYGLNNTFYMDLTSYPDTQSLLYDIIAVDTCGNKSPSTTGHSTILLSASLDTCAGEATLDWSPYYLWTSGVNDYTVFVSENSGAFNSVGTALGTQFTFSGLNRGTAYCYFVMANDGTGTMTSSSNIICTYTDTSASGGVPFLITVEARDSVKSLLVWNEEPTWVTLVGSYDIYRSFDGGPYSWIASVPFGTTYFEDLLDPITNFVSGRGQFCYYVVPVKFNPNLFGCIDTSNTECVEQFPKFVLANSFTPNGDGINDVFSPIRMFIQEERYHLIIFNRWGQKIFETTDINEGWDGTVKGFVVQNDAYVFYVNFTIRHGIPVQKAGTVLLIR